MIDDVLARPPDLPHQGLPSSLGKATATCLLCTASNTGYGQRRQQRGKLGCHVHYSHVAVCSVLRDAF